MKVHKELSISLTVDKILSNDVVWPSSETLVGNGLDFKSKIEITQIFEGNRWHPNLVLFGRDFDYRCFFIRFVEVLDAEDLRDFAFGVDREANRC